MEKTKTPVLSAEVVASPAPPPVAYVFMLDDHGSLRASHVYAVDADLLSRLDLEKAPYRAATEQEIAIAGARR